MKRKLKIKKLNSAINTPKYMTEGAAGFDIAAYLPDSDFMNLEPGKIAIVPTGLIFEIPQGYEASVRPRSGLAFKNGISIVNSPGTIDSDYRGEVKVALINLGEKTFTIKNGDRIAQVVISEAPPFEIELCEDLSETDRGGGGFGHTGLS